MKLQIEIEMDGAAFNNGPDGDPQAEASRILAHLSSVIFRGNMGMIVGAKCLLRDVNGNVVGRAIVTK